MRNAHKVFELGKDKKVSAARCFDSTEIAQATHAARLAKLTGHDDGNQAAQHRCDACSRIRHHRPRCTGKARRQRLNGLAGFLLSLRDRTIPTPERTNSTQ